MNPERWRRLKVAFEEALDKEGGSRADYLEQVGRTDPEIRQEVELLLKSFGKGSFLETPALEAVPELFESQTSNALIGGNLGPYAVRSMIGRGGMGMVFLAFDTRLDRPVAIKMLAPEYTRDPQQRERLRREAKAAAQLSHPGIATVYALEEYENTLYMVSEYVQGDTLMKLMAAGPLSMPTLMDVAVQTARALGAAHENGIVHRDLKPENIIRTGSGLIKILDFGLARIDKENKDSLSRLTRSGAFLGTPAYASPEQLLGASVDFRTDLFSFGVMLYEMASGKHPFGEVDSMTTIARILEADVSALIQRDPSRPEDFDKIVRRCLKKKPSERYGSAQELLADLERLCKIYSGEAVPALVPANAQGEKKLGSLWWWQFHQACAGFGYYAMLYPLWRVKQWLGGVEGSLLFFPALAAVMVAANLRLHLWFTSSCYPSELHFQRRKTAPWIRAADWLWVLLLAAMAVRIHAIHAIIATLLMAVSVGSLVAFSLIEPTTTKAAMSDAEKIGRAVP